MSFVPVEISILSYISVWIDDPPRLKIKWKSKKTGETNGGYSYDILYKAFQKVCWCSVWDRVRLFTKYNISKNFLQLFQREQKIFIWQLKSWRLLFVVNFTKWQVKVNKLKKLIFFKLRDGTMLVKLFENVLEKCSKAICLERQVICLERRVICL